MLELDLDHETFDLDLDPETFALDLDLDHAILEDVASSADPLLCI